MADTRIYAVVIRAVMLIRSDITYGPRLLNSWLPAETWVEALRKLGHIDEGLIFSVRQFNAAFAKSSCYGSAMLRFDGSNLTGMFRVTFQHRHYYYLTQELKQVMYPSPLNGAWKNRVLEIASNALAIPSTRGRPATVDSSTVFGTSVGADGDANEDEEESQKKRQRLEAVASSSCSYWPASPEACQLFSSRGPICRGVGIGSVGVGSNSTTLVDTMTLDESPQETLERRIAALQAVHESEDSWRGVVKGGDPDNFCSKIEIFEIRQRASFLCLAYQLALQKMNQWTWQDCCKEACSRLNDLGMQQATFYRTIAEWNKIYRKLECFPHPNAYVQCGKRPLPRLLETFPDAKEQIVAFGVRNLTTLTIEGVHDFIVSTVIPRLVVVWQDDNHEQQHKIVVDSSGTSTASTADDNADRNKAAVTDSFLQAHRLQSMSFSTTWRWMRLLGFKYDVRRKSFYVDGHEREDVVANRQTFCETYLTKLEPYCNRWIQLPVAKATMIEGLDIGFGHRYFDIIRDEELVEFHIDYWSRHCGGADATSMNSSTQQESINPTTSIRVSSIARPIMIVGQDESVFAQYLLGAKTWIGPKGQRPLLPKSEGDGYMLSAFVSREFGFGRPLTEDELARINLHRQQSRATYTDTHAAMEILGTINKVALTESPFVKYLFIRANNEGYWNSFYMSLQLEDVVDCLQVLYPEFDLVFLFDHSQGHARKRDQALSAQHMSKSYGGAQPLMRDTTIMAEEGYLGPHLPELRVADIQSMTFAAKDKGPWYLSPEQQAMQRHDRPTGKIRLVERSKKLLLEALHAKGVTLQQQRGYSKKELQDFARNNQIELHDRKEQVTPGWEGKPKGLLQVLGERGLIERASLEKYTLEGRKDSITGEVDLHYSLRSLLGNCRDFKEEETALQYLGTQLGVTVLLTPKFHAELAGEGIEYSWAHSKAYYRRMPLSRKRGRDNFKQLVKDCTCPLNVLTKQRIQKFASRARAYICTYHHLHQEQQKRAAAEHEDSNSASNADRTSPAARMPSHIKQELLSYSDIERVSKAFKGHRCVLDFDNGFVHSELRSAMINHE
ncbi:hypothetical protein MHU86_18762 [Fragilaria crotonensis]|nr:hypothetical protein MHU86_18762 [Fragilaria crotonensis]